MKNKKTNPRYADIDQRRGPGFGDDLTIKDNGDQVKPFNGKWPVACMLAFHHISFGILNGEVILKIKFKDGRFEGVQSWRSDYDASK